MTATPNASESDPVSPQLLGALFEYESMPGRFPLALREPRILFENARELLVMSSGRGMAGFTAVEAENAKRAAIFFVRTAMFRSAADHYTLVGLQPGCSDKQLSDHYRLLMRLMHPDFATAGDPWPLDAAVRINQAHDTLASPAQRAEYDYLLSNGLKRSFGIHSPAAVLPTPTEGAVRLALRRWPVPVAALAGVLVIALLLFQLPIGQNQEVAASLSLVVPPQVDATRVEAKGSPPPPTGVKEGPLGMKFETVLALASPPSFSAPAAKPAAKAVIQPLPTQAKPEPRTLPDKAVKPVPTVMPMAVVEEPRRPPAVRESSAAVPGVVTSATSRVAPVAPSPRSVSPGITVFQPQVVPLTPSAPQPVPATAVSALATVAPAPATALQPVGSTGNSPSSTGLSLADAQLAMGQLLQTMQSGRGEDILKGLDRSLRQSAGAADLVSAYNHLVGASRAVVLGPVQLRGRPQADRLVVDGVVQLFLQDQGQPAPVRELRVRALFMQRGDQVVMTELSTGEGRP